jgi:hypothetical protein
MAISHNPSPFLPQNFTTFFILTHETGMLRLLSILTQDFALVLDVNLRFGDQMTNTCISTH